MNDEFVIESDGYPHITKDPDAKMPYTWDWSAWLSKVGSASISSAIVSVPTGLTSYGAVSIVGGMVSQIILGGTVGQSYSVSCKVTTNDGLIDQRTIVIDVAER